MTRIALLGLLTLAILGLTGAFYASQSLGTNYGNSPAAGIASSPPTGAANAPSANDAHSNLDWTLLFVTAAGAAILLIRPRRRATAPPAPEKE